LGLEVRAQGRWLVGEERCAPADIPARGGLVHHQARRQELIKG
jgi:hypothetical protein